MPETKHKCRNHHDGWANRNIRELIFLYTLKSVLYKMEKLNLFFGPSLYAG